MKELRVSSEELHYSMALEKEAGNVGINKLIISVRDFLLLVK